VILISSDDTLGVTGTKVCNLEFRGVRGAVVQVAKHEDVCRLDILMKSLNVREQTDILIRNLHYFRTIV
jgi:hypothetical protein